MPHNVVDSTELAVLTTDVRHLTNTLNNLLNTIEQYRKDIANKANDKDVQHLKNAIVKIESEINHILRENILLKERESNALSQRTDLRQKLGSLEQKVHKLEMETWKLGILLGGSATGGGLLALLAQYVSGLILL